MRGGIPKKKNLSEKEYRDAMKDAGVKLSKDKDGELPKTVKVKGDPQIHYLKLIAERLQILISKFD